MRIFLFIILILLPSITYPQKIKVGVWDNPPLSIINKNGISGFFPDLFREIAKNQDLDFEFIPGKWGSLYEKLENNEIDIFLPIGYSEKRLEKMDFSKYPMFTNWGQLVCRKSENLSSIKSLENKKIAIQHNDIYFHGELGLNKLLTDFHINTRTIFVDNYKEGLKKILDNEVDCALVGKSFLFVVKDDRIKQSSIFVQPVDIHFAYSKKLDPLIKAKIDNEIKKLLDDPHSYYYKKLKFLSESGYTEDRMLFYLNKYLPYIVLIIFSIILLLVIFNYLLRLQVSKKTSELNTVIKKLKDSEGKLKAILSSMPSIIFIINKDFKYVDVITNREELLLAPKEVIVGKNISELFPPEKADMFEHHIKDVILNKVSSNILYDITLKGETRYFESFGVPMMIGDEVFGLFQIIERTDVVKANEAYKKAMVELSIEKDKLNRILNSIKEMVIFADTNGDILYANRSAHVGFGNLFEKNISELEITDKDGKPIKLSTIENFYETNVINIRDSYIVLENKKIEVEGEVQPVFDHQSKMSGILIVLKDITEEKKLERELIKADKLESIGRIASGIAHDFNNYLGAIQNYVTILTLNEDNNVKQIAESITSIIKRSQSLTKQLLTFAKGGAPILKTTNVKHLIKEVTTFSLRGSNIKESFDIPDECFCAEIDEGLFSQVVSNIVINAREAMRDNGSLYVSLRNVFLEENNEYNLKKGEYIKVSIKDSGPGVPESIGNKIFEPFFTTKSEGTGLGLATCYAIVKQHNGILTYTNHSDGCEFIFLIPSVDKTKCQQVSTSYNEHQPVSNKGIKVLYMDDEDILRDSFELLMEALGAETTTVEKGEDVLDIVNKQHFDMIVLDLTIKTGLNGVETIKKLKSMGINSYFVVSSGYSDDPVIQNMRSFGFDDYLPKPFSLKEVKEMFDKYQKKKQVNQTI